MNLKWKENLVCTKLSASYSAGYKAIGKQPKFWALFLIKVWRSTRSNTARKAFDVTTSIQLMEEHHLNNTFNKTWKTTTVKAKRALNSVANQNTRRPQIILGTSLKEKRDNKWINVKRINFCMRTPQKRSPRQAKRSIRLYHELARCKISDTLTHLLRTFREYLEYEWHVLRRLVRNLCFEVKRSVQLIGGLSSLVK